MHVNCRLNTILTGSVPGFAPRLLSESAQLARRAMWQNRIEKFRPLDLEVGLSQGARCCRHFGADGRGTLRVMLKLLSFDLLPETMAEPDGTGWQNQAEPHTNNSFTINRFTLGQGRAGSFTDW